MLEFIDHLAEWSSGVPIFCVCTTRPELFEKHPEWGGGKRNATTVSLSPLSDVDTARLIAELLERSVLPAQTQVMLLERAGGNPLFAEEFVRMLRDRGVDDADVPGSRPGADRRTPGHARSRAQAADPGRVGDRQGVLGRGCRPTWRTGCGGVRSALHELTRKELVKPARLSSVGGEREYVFWHALVRDVAYGQIPRAERVERHVAAARWIETATGARAADHAEILAHHYLTALELAEVTGTSDPQMLRSAAIDHLLIASGTTMGVDTAAARRLSMRACDLIEDGDPRLGPALMQSVEAGYALGADLETQRALMDRAEAASLELGDDRTLGRVFTWRSILTNDGTIDKLTLAERAVELLEPLPGPELARA